MKKDFYTENAIVVLHDGDTWSGIKESTIVLFNNDEDPSWIEGLDGPSCLWQDDDFYILDDDGTLPKDLVYGYVSISFLLDFYLKHREAHGDEI